MSCEKCSCERTESKAYIGRAMKPDPTGQIQRIQITTNQILKISTILNNCFKDLSDGINNFMDFQANSSIHSAESEEELMEKISNMNLLKCIEDEFTITSFRNNIEKNFILFDKLIEDLNQLIPLYNSLKNYYSSLILNDQFKETTKEENQENEQKQTFEETGILKTHLSSDKKEIPSNESVYGFDFNNR